jgi:uncharacterized protein (TIGR03435 family)
MQQAGGIMRMSGTLAVWLGLAAFGQAQESFEVASVKPHPGIVTFAADPSVKGNRVTATASTLLDLIEVAYHARRDQLLGAPGWADSDHYDLEARAGASAITTDQMRRMLQALLAERFQLRIRHETREVPMYALVVSKKGPKLRESSPDEVPKGRITGSGSGMHMEVAKGTMAQLANRLSGNGAGRPVVDETGLTGVYSYELDWGNAAGPDSELPTLSVALQEQLGLRLEPIKGTSDFIIVEHVERPSAN